MCILYEKGVKRKMCSYNNGDSEKISQNKELFKLALAEAMESKIRNIEEEIEDVEVPQLSIRYKIQMNRLFREQVGGDFIPFPEIDGEDENEAT